MYLRDPHRFRATRSQLFRVPRQLVGGRYLDQYEKRDGVWKFTHRSLAMDWCNVQDVRPEDYDTFAAGAVRGRHDPGDASYAELTLFGRVSK